MVVMLVAVSVIVRVSVAVIVRIRMTMPSIRTMRMDLPMIVLIVRVFQTRRNGNFRWRLRIEFIPQKQHDDRAQQRE